jgi:hypothetical protein
MRKLNCLTASVALLAASFLLSNVACAQLPPPEAMISYWKMDEGSGTQVGDSVGSNTGTLLFNPVWTTGVDGSALYFHGGAQFDPNTDAVVVPHSPSLDITGSFTIEAWIKALPGQHYHMIVDKHSGPPGQPPDYRGYSLLLTEGRLRLVIYSGGETIGDLGSVAGSPDLRDNEWHHVVGAWNGCTMRNYVDGELVGERAWAHPPGSNTANLGIGKRLLGWGGYVTFFGVIDEVAIYDEALPGCLNDPPIADAGPDQTVVWQDDFDGLTKVVLDATGSSDPEDDPLTVEWSAADVVIIDDPTAPISDAYFPCGSHLVTLAVDDGINEPVTDDVLITVLDETAPIVEFCTATPGKLWPPDHRMVDVAIFLKATDQCTSPQDLLVFCEVTSNEPDDGTGDGEFTGDVNGDDGYSQPVPVMLAYDADVDCFMGTVALRAERDGSESGRTYTIICDVWDFVDGNFTTADCVVVVPHDKGKKK